MKKLVLACVWSVACATTIAAQDVRYNFDKSAEFSKFKTYKWVTLKDARRANPLAEKQIQSSIDAQLAAKGLSKVEVGPG